MAPAEENVKVGVSSLIVPVGPVIVGVGGGVASTVKARVAAALVPPTSEALTEKV